MKRKTSTTLNRISLAAVWAIGATMVQWLSNAISLMAF